MFLPFFGAAAAAVVGRNDEGRTAAVLRHRLHRVPQLGDKSIHALSAIEHQIVAPLVSPIVRLAVTHEQHACGAAANVIEERDLHEGIESILFVEARRGIEELGEQGILRCISRGLRCAPAGLHQEVAARLVENIVEDSPGPIDGDMSCEFRQLVEPLEHGHIGIRSELIAVNVGIGKSDGHLVVAGIGKSEPVGDVRNAALQLIAEDLPFLRDCSPDEGKQDSTPLFDVIAPEFALQCVFFHPVAAVLGIKQQRVGAREHLLPAQSVAHDQYDGLGLLRIGCRREAKDENDAECGGGDESAHDDSPRIISTLAQSAGQSGT